MASVKSRRRQHAQGNGSVAHRVPVGLSIAPTFCPPDVNDPFDTVQWELRTAVIKDESGEALFEQHDCEIPAGWSQLATNVVVSKYFYGENGTKEREQSVRQLIHRVSRTIADWVLADGYFASEVDAETFYRDLTWLCLHQHGSFNSPVWFNVGLHHQYKVSGARCNWHWDPKTGSVQQPENPYEYPQASACFIQSVQDNMEDIMRLATSEAMLFKFGSGTGTDLSTIRSHREKLSGGGRPSGPLSFMRVYDQIAAVVKSGGKTRRAAKMQSLKIWHPDILEFIECKWKEERKAHVLIEKGGYEANFNGEAYSSILFQNANLSVRVTDEYMQTVESGGRWKTRWVSGAARGEAPEYDSRELLMRMAECAWHCGDPGVQYDSTINRWHTCPNSGRINASNPCVTGDTLVATADGYRRIEDLVDKVVQIVDGNGQPAWAERVFKTGRKPVFELKTRSGYRLRLTADHRVYTLNRGDVPAAELTKDDVVKLQGAGFGSHSIPESLGELVGAALGDGCISRQPNQDFVFVTLGHGETEIARRLQEDLVHCKLLFGGTDGRSQRATQVVTTATSLRVGTTVRSVLAELSKYAVLDEGASKKRLADSVFALDRTSQAAILRALFTTDGTVANYGGKSQYVSLDSTSLYLLEQIQLMLLGFGIKTKIYGDRRALRTADLPDGAGGVKSYPVQQMHSLRISRASRVAFEHEIGFLPESAKFQQLAELNKRVGTYGEPMADYVASLSACGEEDVYDLTEPGTHHFVANGVVVHNCSEYMFLDDTACNLASINLMKFRVPDGSFDVARFQQACRIFFVAQEILVDHASYPTDRITANSHRFRPLGLGYSNLGSLIMASGIPYDSDAARGLCGSLTALLHGAGNLASAEMAAVKGPFDGYAENREPFLRVMQMHRDAVEEINDDGPGYLKEAARVLWDRVLEQGRRHGFRNAQATVLAPTGTISFMMDCDTTGIEPDIALVKYKSLAGGGMLKIINRTVPLGLRVLGYDEPQIDTITRYIDEHDTIEGAPQLRDEHLPVFDCAFTPAGGVRSIAWRAHVRMMAAAQPFLSGAISKTVNMPSDVTPQDIADAYLWGWQLGLKALAIYRDGSKQSQPLSTKSEASKAAEKVVARPRRERLPDTRQSITHKFNVGGHEGYINVGLYPDGRPGELFITMAKEGSTVGGLMDSFGTAVSMSLQYGVPLEVLVNKFSHTRFEPMGHTTNPDIAIAKSVVDYIFRWLGITFLPGFREANSNLAYRLTEETAAKPTGDTPAGAPKASSPNKSVLDIALRSRGNAAEVDGNGGPVVGSRSEQFARFQSDAPSCDNCGSITVRNGNCYLCHNCGNSMGCS